MSIVEKIRELKEKRGALILAHNYQLPQIQDIADFTGDSLELSRKAAAHPASVIIFCGVHFMAETAAILSPNKTVILPAPDAGCPMADMVDARLLLEMRSKYPEAKVVCYVNTTAEVKAVSDICCTSANAVDIVSSIEEDIIFVPDEYLGAYAASKTGRKFHLWPGYCPTHAMISPIDVKRAREDNPGCKVLVHPECRSDVAALADEVLSTGGMLRYAARSDAGTIAVGTETGILYRLSKDNPGKRFIPVTRTAVCPNMKKITLEKVLRSLETLEPRITVPEDVRSKAYGALLPLLT